MVLRNLKCASGQCGLPLPPGVIRGSSAAGPTTALATTEWKAASRFLAPRAGGSERQAFPFTEASKAMLHFGPGPDAISTQAAQAGA